MQFGGRLNSEREPPNAAGLLPLGEHGGQPERRHPPEGHPVGVMTE